MLNVNAVLLDLYPYIILLVSSILAMREFLVLLISLHTPKPEELEARQKEIDVAMTDAMDVLVAICGSLLLIISFELMFFGNNTIFLADMIFRNPVVYVWFLFRAGKFIIAGNNKKKGSVKKCG